MKCTKQSLYVIITLISDFIKQMRTINKPASNATTVNVTRTGTHKLYIRTFDRQSFQTPFSLLLMDIYKIYR